MRAGPARAVVDTNVIVSSVISDRGSPRRVLEAWRDGRFVLVSCRQQIQEVARALRYDRIRVRYRLGDDDIRAVLALLWTQAEIAADPAEGPRITIDPDDDVLLALCVNAGAQYLVTGDRPLLSLGRHGRAAIISPREFAEFLSRASEPTNE
jgi:uncharacterized protein